MEMDVNNRNGTSHFLRLAEAESWNWVAFTENPDAFWKTHTFHGFETAGEAIEFCTGQWTAADLYDQGEEPAVYNYMPIDTLRAAAETLRETPLQLVPLPVITDRLNAQGVQMLRSNREEAIPLIQSGGIFPVQFDRMIDPEQEVDRFKVLAHQHAGHQVYEIGHRIRVVDSFTSLEKAEQCFKELVRQYTDNTDQNDYLLIGQYKGQEFRHDLDGWPESYSGLTLKSACYQYGPDLQAKAWRVEEVNTLDEPKGVRQFLYARYDLQEGKIKLLDERLKETRPEDIKISTYPSQFIYEKPIIKNTIIMNEKNYDYLKNQVKFMGFGEDLDKQIGEKMQLQEPEFKLQHQAKFGQDDVSSTLHFEKGKESEMYFFNSFDLAYKQANADDVLKQTYYVGKENNLTLKEHYNMLEGRSVHKVFNKLEQVGEGENIKFKATKETYQAWTDLNFKKTDELGNFDQRKMFGFNLEKTLAKYPVIELEDNYDKRRLIASLEKGNVQKATILVDGKEQKVAVSANPRDNKVNFYDENMQRLEVKQAIIQKQELGEGPKQEENSQINQSQTNTVTPDNNPANERQGEAPVIGHENGISTKDQPVQENKPEGQVQGAANTIGEQNKKEGQKQGQPSEKQDNNRASQRRRQGMKVS